MKSLHCRDCGLDYSSKHWGLDTYLPDWQWKLINKGKERGVLCANCIIRRAVKLGATVVFLRLDIKRKRK